jgi:siroheme synthase-like protein
MSQTPYPVFLNLAGVPVLVVGAGNVGLRKAAALVQAGARVCVISPAFRAEFDGLALTRINEKYDARHMMLETWKLVFAVTNDAAVNAQIVADARGRNIFVNRADAPDEADFTNGASGKIGENSAAVLAVSTNSASPVLAARIRDEAIAGIDPLVIEWTQLIAAWREKARTKIADPAARRKVLLRIASSEMEHILRRLGPDQASAVFDSWLAPAGDERKTGDSPHDS